MTVDATDELLVACRRFIQAADLCEERVAARLGIGRSDLRAVNLLENGPVAQGVIARELGLTPPTVTALIDRLEAHGLVRRTPHPTDRRVTLVELLPRAWGQLAGVYLPIGGAVLDAAAGLKPRERTHIAALLHQWAHSFDKQPG
jgi:DNA-binding MarR family transcriptional regulator